MKARTRRFLKLTIGAELRKWIVTSIKLRRGPANDNRDFKPVVRKAHSAKPIKTGIGDKGYDDEKDHEFLREELHAQSMIPARYQDVPVWRKRTLQEGDEARVLEEDHMSRRLTPSGVSRRINRAPQRHP